MDELVPLENADAAGTKPSVLRDEVLHHQPVRLQQIVYRHGVQLRHQLVGMAGALNLFYLVRLPRIRLPFRTAATCSRERELPSIAREAWMERMRF